MVIPLLTIGGSRRAISMPHQAILSDNAAGMGISKHAISWSIVASTDYHSRPDLVYHRHTVKPAGRISVTVYNE